MTIIDVPNTFDGLLNETKAMQVRLSGIAFGIASSASTAWQASYRLRKAVDASLDYLYEDPKANALNLSSSISDLPFEYTLAGYKAIEPHFGDRKAVTEIHANVAELTQAALDIRAPLVVSKLARYGFDQLCEAVNWYADMKTPVNSLIETCVSVLGGGEVPFISLRNGITSVDDYIRMVSGSGAAKTKHEDRFRETYGYIIGFTKEIMREAEARLPQPPVPVTPKREPIFQKAAAPTA